MITFRSEVKHGFTTGHHFNYNPMGDLKNAYAYEKNEQRPLRLR